MLETRRPSPPRLAPRGWLTKAIAAASSARSRSPAANGSGCRLGQLKRGAVQRILDPWVAPDRPQDAVLDVVERERLALDRDELGAPRPDAEQAGREVDVADRPHRVAVEDHAHRQRVVKVGPEGELLGPVGRRDGHRRQGREVARQRRAVAPVTAP
jgi:hypothetical protein